MERRTGVAATFPPSVRRMALIVLPGPRRSRVRRRRHHARVPLLLVIVLLAAACFPAAGPPAPRASDVGADGDADVSADAATSSDVPASASACRDAASNALGGRAIDHVRPVGASADPAPVPVVQLDAQGLLRLVELHALAPDGTPCTERVVLTGVEDVLGRGLAGAAAVAQGLDLIVATADQGADGVGPDVTTLADAVRALLADPLADGPAELVRGRTPVLVLAHDLLAQVDVVASAGDGVVPVVIDADTATDGVVATLDLLRAAGGAAHEVRWTASTLVDARALDAVLVGLAAEGIDATRWTPDAAARPVAELWLGDVRQMGTALMAAATAVRRGAAFVAVDGTDLRAGVERTERVRAAVGQLGQDGRIVLVGDVDEATMWQLDTVSVGTPLPGGGFLPLEERRIVALYGTPGTASLGLLGEQDTDATMVRAREVAQRYADAADGRIAVPGLDVITTIASSAAEPTGDFSRRVPIERIRPLVDVARSEGAAVLLDLQPGRSSFLVQAKEYEELLREPHVHLALDPEWRIGPRERHLVRIGSVDADEVQAVADWLAELVRRERLPQKVLMLHQFTLAMLPERDTIVIPDELIGVVHIDGQGPLPTKNNTYAVLTAGAEEHWVWGWKNFTRIDTPVATPEQTLERLPVPLIVTYQ